MTNAYLSKDFLNPIVSLWRNVDEATARVLGDVRSRSIELLLGELEHVEVSADVRLRALFLELRHKVLLISSGDDLVPFVAFCRLRVGRWGLQHWRSTAGGEMLYNVFLFVIGEGVEVVLERVPLVPSREALDEVEPGSVEIVLAVLDGLDVGVDSSEVEGVNSSLIASIEGDHCVVVRVAVLMIFAAYLDPVDGRGSGSLGE